MSLHIAGEDLKPRYRPIEDENKKRIIEFLKSIKDTYDVLVRFEIKKNNVAAFTITDEDQSVDKEIKRTIMKYLQGELCDPSSMSKYSKPPSRVKPTPSQKAVEEKFSKLTISVLEAHDTKQESGPLELRQFACLKCRHSWWCVVHKHKPVSRCRNGKCNGQRYDPVPKEKEFGIGRYKCKKCDRYFYADCEFTDVLDCRICNEPCTNPVIHPKWTKRKRTLNPDAKPFKPIGDASSQPGRFEPPPERYRGTQEPNPGGACRFVPSTGSGSVPSTGSGSVPSTGSGSVPDIVPFHTPFHTPYRHDGVEREFSAGKRKPPEPRKSRRPHAFNPSPPHKSTGSTISTCLSQNDDTSECEMDYNDDITDDKPYPRRFECRNCKNKYTVRCKMSNTASCYKCEKENKPLGPSSADAIDRTTRSRHSCSECPRDGSGKCPNLG